MIPATIKHALLAVLLALAPLPAFADAQVAMKNFDFAPMAVTIKQGETVVWKNLDGEPHTVVSIDGAFRSAALDQNDTFKFTFTNPGIYKYLCSIHPKMMATITVK
jgi:plastocyanin